MGENGVIRVLLVDDHEVFADSLARTLADETDLEIVAAVTTAAEAIDLGGSADVVVCDFRLADGTGAALAAQLLARYPQVHVVMLTASQDEGVLTQALDAGCTGFVTKSEPLAAVVATIRAASRGEAIITPRLLAQVLSRLGSRQPGSSPQLTPRELEVLELVCHGLTNQQIADRLTVARGP